MLTLLAPMLALLLQTGATPPISHPALAEQIAEQVLIEAERIEFGGGEQLFEPTAILAVELLLKSHQASELFQDVYRRAFGPAGRVYALIGLELLDDPHSASLRADFLGSPQSKIDSIKGCIVFQAADPHKELSRWLAFAHIYPPLANAALHAEP